MWQLVPGRNLSQICDHIAAFKLLILVSLPALQQDPSNLGGQKSKEVCNLDAQYGGCFWGSEPFVFVFEM